MDVLNTTPKLRNPKLHVTKCGFLNIAPENKIKIYFFSANNTTSIKFLGFKRKSEAKFHS